MLDPTHDAEVHARPAVGERFAFLDALRGLGALGVTCYHVHRYRPLEIPADHILPNFIQFVVRHGWIGVQMFWVIAGFVVAYSLRNTAVGPASFGNFTLRRVLRLGTPYWTAILLVVALDFAARQFLHIPSLVEDPVGWPQLAANLAFLQDVLEYGNISAGTWFVCVDLQFGLLFMLMLGIAQLLSRPLLGTACGGKTNACVLTLVFLPLGLLSLFAFNLDDDLDAWAIYFFCMPLLGALAWWALEGRIPRGVFWAFAAVMAAGVAYRWQLGMKYHRPLEIGVALTVGIIVYLVGRCGHLGDWLRWRWLQYLGRISYSLYLIHYATSWIVVSVGIRLTGDNATAAVAWLVGAVVASILAAHLLYTFVELPSLRLVKRFRVE